MLPINNPGGILTLAPETPSTTDKDYPALWQTKRPLEAMN